MTPREVIDEVLTAHGASWTPEDRALAARILARASVLGVSEAAGSATGMWSAQPELAQLAAQVASLAAAGAQNTQNIMRAAFARVMGLGVDIALKGLGLALA